MPRRIGRPGLLGTMARTAVIAGTAGAVNRSMNRAASSREQTQADAQAYREQQAPPAAAPPPAGDDVIAKLGRLAELHDAGALTDAEFAAAKAKLLA
ncbi:SHOCT domain-containing protein [Glycomyces harbinensis]|uniref:Short C-terminal domain-containing protein n=1 Tax=Glycomyces harbinensis TaxID=58114 RepID=A0A1G7BFI9_9ACTN|nr:SHOCT domain-containing protein [Glycomyces harbinensis]SDE25166.1 Short C-terminal domain-containing protein [Glycomyces harbinensis]